MTTAEKLVHAFVISRLDYCNSLFQGCPYNTLKTLQVIPNAALRLMTRAETRDHISPILASLHGLPVKSRIEFKIHVLTYKAIHGQASFHLPELIVPNHSSKTLCFQDAALLGILRISKNIVGGRTFS